MADTKPVALVIGASRGIGRQIAISLAEKGYIVIAAAKSTSDPDALPSSSFPPDPNSPQSTINTVAREITQAGNECVPIPVNTRDTTSITQLFSRITSQFNRLDALIYNSGAIWWSSVAKTPFKRFKLMQEVNVEGLYACIQASFPLFAATNWKARIVVVCPPIYSRFFRGKTAYAVGKVGMSVLVQGLAMDFVREGKSDMAVSGIWPATAVESAATEQVVSANADEKRNLRLPTVFSDAVLGLLGAETEVVSGLLAVDEDFLREHIGVKDFGKYNVVPGSQPRRMLPVRFPDLSVDEQDEEGVRVDSTVTRQQRRAKL